MVCLLFFAVCQKEEDECKTLNKVVGDVFAWWHISVLPPLSDIHTQSESCVCIEGLKDNDV